MILTNDSIGTDVNYVLDLGNNKAEIRPGKITQVINGETARLDISTGSGDKRKEHYALALYDAGKKPGTFHLLSDAEEAAAPAGSKSSPNKSAAQQPAL